MIVLRVLLFMLTLSPSRGDADIELRFREAAAIVNATSNERLQDTLTRIIWKESSFRAEVADCRIKGDKGRAMGAFQIQPRSSAEREIACGDLDGQARLALERIEESLRVCRHMPEAERLGIYVDGKCDSKKARRQSRERWGAR
jgi:hypothetical protein